MKLLQELNEASKRAAPKVKGQNGGLARLRLELAETMRKLRYNEKQIAAAVDAAATAIEKMPAPEPLQRRLFGKGWEVEVSQDLEGYDAQKGTVSATIKTHEDGSRTIFVQGFKRDIPIDAEDDDEVVEILDDIAHQGKKWFAENDPDHRS